MVISRHITGVIRTRRYIVEIVLGMIYVLIPWLSINGKPLMRLDIPERKFHLLGAIYIPQEGIFLHLFLLTMGLSLFLFTSLIGRVWCGWACPQTVFTDFFDFIGRLVQGKKYGKKDASLFSKILLYTVWLLVSFVSSFHIIAYFNDPQFMIQAYTNGESWKYSFPYFTLFFTFTLMADMVFVREQFCKYACPYAKFQTVLMDADSYNVTYDYKRGEPRRNKTVKIGDCTACNMCLVVCPTGIDIRDGLNVGCIACGKCVDACTVQMGKENKKSLIGYYSLNQIEKKEPIRWVRPRTIVYATLLLVVIITSITLLINRVPLYLSIIPDRNIAPILDPAKNTIKNFYTVNLRNISYEDMNLKFEIEKDSNLEPNILIGSDTSTLNLKPDSSEQIKLILESKNIGPSFTSKITSLKLNIIDQKRNITLTRQLPMRFKHE